MACTPSTSRQHLASDICISLDNVTINYNNLAAVRNVYCDIPSGKVTALIGPSG
ncbi:MAG TPA: phosphate ABC transporter ATP-binding protein, partial [Prochlorococcus sp.]